MNYENIYKKLYEKAKSRGKRKHLPKMENHHFVPSSLYYSKYKSKIMDILDIQFKNNDDAINIYPLTIKEHYIAHLLLFKIYPDLKEIMYGLNQVMNRYASSNQYVGHKIKIYKMISESNSGFVNCKNKLTNETYRVTQEEFNSNENLVGINAGSKLLTEKFVCAKCGDVIHRVANFKQHNKSYCEFGEKLLPTSLTDKVNCQFCLREMNRITISDHERCCELNPNKQHRKHNMVSATCSHCGKTGNLNVIKRHETFECELNINKETATPSKRVTCKYCNDEFPARGLKSHENRCKKLH